MSQRATLEEVERVIGQIGKMIDEATPQGWHFTLVLACPEAALMTYCSNLQREGSIQMLRELADKLGERGEAGYGYE